MNQKTIKSLLKIVFIVIFLPAFLIWYIWKKTEWSKRNKWIATAGIAVVFLLAISSDDKVETKTKNEAVVLPQAQTSQQQPEVEKQNTPEPVDPKVAEAEQTTIQVKEEVFKVASVVDGDTIKLENGQVVRYIGIDTPETVHPSKPVQCFGKEASTKNKEMVLGKEVRLVKDVSETDKYGRILRYVYVGDNLINDYLVRNGYASSYSYPPDVKFQDQFKQAEAEARTNKRGLWADGACDTETVQTTPAPTTISAPVVPKSSISASPGSFACNCSKACAQMSSCAEAQYQLDVCGCTKRDADKDGVACDSDCQ
ncbi:MAG: thermonuclease family protein [Parcubacteria group bacterium]